MVKIVNKAIITPLKNPYSKTPITTPLPMPFLMKNVNRYEISKSNMEN